MSDTEDNNEQELKSVYFFCEALADLTKNPDANTDYQHCIISLAEGLTELGYICYGNVDYWQSDVDSPYLITQAPVAVIEECSAVIISCHWFIKNDRPIIPSHVPMYLMADMQENAHIIRQYPYLSNFEKVLYCGYVKHYTYQSNFVPWAFGLTNRIIKAVESADVETTTNRERNRKLLVNFRMEHTSRQLAERNLLPILEDLFSIDNRTSSLDTSNPYDALMDRQTGRRHYPSYYKTLCTTSAVAAFGGYFASSLSRDRFSFVNRLMFYMIRAFGLSSKTLVQHDSWRFWESLVAGALTFHADLEECGAEYPVNPIHGKHYIGIPSYFFSKPDSNKLLENLEDLNFDTIATDGKYFALTNYSPIAVAKRFLTHL